MENRIAWISAAEALRVLNVLPQTLYANVSRGKIRAKADHADPRRSLYHHDDVLRMARRANGRRKIDAVSAQAMQYGDPVLPTAVSTAVDGRLLYHGIDACQLANSASLEDVAALLWRADPATLRAELAAAMHQTAAAAQPAGAHGRHDRSAGGGLAGALLALARRSAGAPPSLGQPPAALRAEAAAILATVTHAFTGDAPPENDMADASISLRLALSWHRPEHADLIRRALVLMADHELNASTFATRVAVSTGASLAAGVLAGLATLSGPLHGGAGAECARLLALAAQVGASAAVSRSLASGRALPGFGHPLYPEGDPRARALMNRLPSSALHSALLVEAEAQTGELPSVDLALTLLTAACGLPPEAPLVLFALGRCVGWLAHAQEQVQANHVIRPRARYVGPGESGSDPSGGQTPAARGAG